MTDDPQAKLCELLETLAYYRAELLRVKRRGDPRLLIETAQRLVRTQATIIRLHCQLNGLPLPADVAEKDEVPT